MATKNKNIPISDKFAFEVCKQTVGSLSRTTWNVWKGLLYIPKTDKLISVEDFKKLQAFALLRKQFPYKKITKKEVEGFVKQSLFKHLEDINTIVIEANVQLSLNYRKGEELPLIIKEKLGRKVSFSTLYFWGNRYPKLKFSKDRKYSLSEIDQWLEIASKQV